MPTKTGSRKSSSTRAKSSSGGRQKSSKARSSSPGAAARKSASRSRSTAAKSSQGRSRSRSSTRAMGAKSRASSGRGATRSSSSSKTTIDHDEIREWVEARGGQPATVEGTERGSEAAGLLRIDFPGYSGENTLAPLEWEEFFEKFEEAKLAFLYDTNKGSKFNKFVARGKKRF